VLLENGWTNTVTTGPGSGNVAAYPQSFLHIGTFDPHLEFTFGPPSFNRSSVGLDEQTQHYVGAGVSFLY
jgi:hypothetical protein